MLLLMTRLACVIGIIIFIIGCNQRSDNNSASASAPKTAVDIDLSSMSSTVLFAQITNMLENPNEHLGKSVRAKGTYSVWCMSGTDECHHFVTVADGAACCQTGLEFQYRDGKGKYPKELAPIEVEGVFSEYEKFDRALYYIAVDGITVLDK